MASTWDTIMAVLLLMLCGSMGGVVAALALFHLLRHQIEDWIKQLRENGEDI